VGEAIWLELVQLTELELEPANQNQNGIRKSDQRTKAAPKIDSDHRIVDQVEASCCRYQISVYAFI
jgi:hypothetical protein